MDKRSNCFKVHPQTDAGPCVYCGQDITANRYIHLIQKVSDAPEFCLFVKSNFNISELSCICKKCEIKFKRLYFRSTENSLLGNDEPVNKKAFSNGIKSVEDDKTLCFLNHFNLCQKSGDHTTNIETLYFQTVFDICISDKFPDKEQSFRDTLCHQHYNILSHSNSRKELFE